jgi:antitoxin ParD1/3/4/toxin ParE1/3/4
VEVRDHIIVENPTASERLAASFKSAFEMLAMMPNIGHQRPEFMHLNVRVWTVHPYLVVYVPTTRPLLVARVLHGSRDLEPVFDELLTDLPDGEG